jgi:hypothetical protein
MTVTRLEVTGWPRREVAELDARLSRYHGGAQLWRLAGGDRTAIGILIPEAAPRADRCHEIVAEWKREQSLP